ncbi:hypothetical protein [Streptomyces sp. C1-2]|uniref:hypothetical protein n=1 Tax=Streptomyces sp. C1-2 TaxID=2720022 RepID=UPI0014324C4D|nr:hypothetical protein [Streptomyces sp. C1-2]NJP71921.1 hypothetical protein [Streptomyces sp. C1-2]
MQPEEVVVLARYVHALCPAQKIDQYTPDAWCDVFDEVPQYSLADCREGAARVAKRQPFVAPAEIIAEVRKIREERLDGFQYEPTPGETGAEAAARRREQIRACANGQRPAVLAIAGRVRPELAGMLDGLGDRLALDDGEEERQQPALGPGKYARQCPRCEALVGRPCRTPKGKVRPPHPQRSEQPVAGGGAERAARAALSALTAEQRVALLAELGGAS